MTTIIPDALDPGRTYVVQQKAGEWEPTELDPRLSYVLIIDGGRHQLYECRVHGVPPYASRGYLEYERRTDEKGPAV